MPAYIGLLRAVNVGGMNKLPMNVLKGICVAAGFTNVQTYIASGNVVFVTKQREPKIKAALENRLQAYMGKSVGVIIRTADEMATVLEANPFASAAPNRTVVIFFNDPPPLGALNEIQGRKDEELSLGRREIYVAYGAGMGRSKLKIPMAVHGTARNINTITKLVELAIMKEEESMP